ncbi:MAG TPA: MIP/aquaporin family protein [Rubrobacteraceae bacterium]|nr:MIP/aquaporin family protein [Rubrobacteraceae bacterium]
MDKNDEKNAAKRDSEQRIAGQPDREGAEAPQGSPAPQLPPAPQPPTEELPPPPPPERPTGAKDLPEAPQASIEELPPTPQGRDEQLSPPPQAPPPQELSPPPKVPEEELPPVPQAPHADLPAAPTAPNNPAEELPGVVFPDGDEKQEKEGSCTMSGSGNEPRDEDRPRVRRSDASERRRADSPLHDERYEDVRFEWESRSGGMSGSATRSPYRGQQNDDEGGQSSGLYGSQVDSSNLMGSAVAELIGTFILIYTGCAVAVAAILQRPTAGPIIYDSLAVALAFGLALVAIVAAIGHVSGAHVNPAITLALAVTKKFPWQYVPIYIGAQLVGAVLGAVAVWITYGEAAREAASLAATFPTDGVGDLRALVVEILVTFILMFIVISVATDERAPAGVAPLAVGFALACGVLIAGPITGGSLNPARTLGPMIMAGQFTAVWVYIVGPIVGAVLAALVYNRFASQSDATE